MLSTIRVTRATLAAGISLWMAVLACVMGCMQPPLARDEARSEEPRQTGSTDRHDAMARMENCHHSNGPTVPPSDRKPTSDAGVSCCPLEVTVTPKSDTAVRLLDSGLDFGPQADFRFEISQVSSRAPIAEPVFRSGRDTLLATQLLRI